MLRLARLLGVPDRIPMREMVGAGVANDVPSDFMPIENSSENECSVSSGTSRCFRPS